MVFANSDFSPEPYEANYVENIIMYENCSVILQPRQLTTHIVELYLEFVETAANGFGEIHGVCANDGCVNFSHTYICLEFVPYRRYNETHSLHLLSILITFRSRRLQLLSTSAYRQCSCSPTSNNSTMKKNPETEEYDEEQNVKITDA